MSEVAVGTLADFLLARIAEDEAAASAARYNPIVLSVPRRVGKSAARAFWNGPADPARALAECEGWDPELGTVGQVTVQVLRLLALPYADHPEFREEWRV